MSALIKHIQDTYNLDLKSVGIRFLEIKFQHPSLERIEDYRSGHLNDIAERYHVSQTRTKVCKSLTELLPFIPLIFNNLLVNDSNLGTRLIHKLSRLK